MGTPLSEHADEDIDVLSEDEQEAVIAAIAKHAREEIRAELAKADGAMDAERKEWTKKAPRAHVDRNYAWTLTRCFWNIGQQALRNRKNLRTIEKAVGQVQIPSEEDYRAEQDSDWTTYANEIARIRKFGDLARMDIEEISSGIMALQYNEMAWGQRDVRMACFAAQGRFNDILKVHATTEAEGQALRQATKEIRESIGEGDTPTHLLKGKRMPYELYRQYRLFKARAEAEMEKLKDAVEQTRAELTELTESSGFSMVADEMGGPSRRVEYPHRFFRNVQAGSELVAIVVPDETVAKVLEGANAIGQVVQDLAFGYFLDKDLTARAKKIAKDPAKRREAVGRLCADPLIAARFARKQRERELTFALNVLHIPATGLLMGAAFGLKMAGPPGEIAAKVVLPWVWPAAKNAVIGFFNERADLAIRAAEEKWAADYAANPDIFNGRTETALNQVFLSYAEELTGPIDEEFRDLKNKIADKQAEIEADIAKRTEKLGGGWNKIMGRIWAELKKAPKEVGYERIKKEGLEVITPDGIAKAARQLGGKLLNEILPSLPVDPVARFDGLSLLAMATTFSGPSRVSQSE